MSKLLFNKAFSEHTIEDISSLEMLSASSILYKQKADCKCIEITQDSLSKKLNSSFYIGTDWLYKNEIAVYVAPKLNDNAQQTDYLKMLFSCLRHSDVASFTKDLYEIKFEEPFIEIEQKQDLLTPLLVVQFLQVVKTIVRKRLKKSYYKVEQNLNAKIKGKVLVAQTLKQNIIKNKPTKTFCQYDEFGFNCIENRILKRTLVFVQKYLALFPDYAKLASPVINYCLPAFHAVDENIDLKTLKGVTHNSFYKEYEEALHISSLILKRFGYNIKEIDILNNKTVQVPPFWIDMPKLFELYVLGMLKDKYFNNIKFQIQGTYGQPDFILASQNEKLIIDTKYKRYYNLLFKELSQKNRDNVSKDIRQLSGYARDTEILSTLGFKTAEEQDKVVDCLIIYPDQTASDKLADDLKEKKISGFTRFYKMAIKLPVISD
jgi:5-methylcytosine-specific restriction endonuclease McrBC regulatory subunit McrC